MTLESVWPRRVDRVNALALALLGMLSGAAAWKLIDAADSMGLNFHVEWSVFLILPLSVFPGLVFGLVIGLFILWRGRLTAARLAGYVLASGVGYFAAFHVAFHIIDALSADKSVAGTMAGGVPAGFVGSVLLGLATILLLRAPARLTLQSPVAVGTVFGALLALIVDDQDGRSFLIFLVLWQGAYATSLAPLLRPKAASPPAAVSDS